MLATISPMLNDVKPPYDHHSYKFHHNRYSPPESPRQLPSFFNGGGETTMSNSHRGLPAPLGLSLAPPERPQTSHTSLGHLPAPPSQWAGHDESMRNWLLAKAEEDRRRQEEERTKQETLRLDQRKIEQNMLRDSLNGGVPPPMVPLIFAGMAGQGNLSNHTLEWAQQYLAQLSLENQRQQQQLQVQQQQIHQHQQPQPPQEQHNLPHQGPPSPPARRDSRILPPNPYAAQSQTQSNATIAPSQSQPPRTLNHSISNSSLSRLNTAELQPQSIPTSTPQSRHSQHPLQQSQTAQSEASSGPSLFFHHWTPPNSSNQPPTPATKSQQVSPHTQHPASHLRSDYQSTPKKRKLGNGSNTSAHSESSPHDIDHREYSPRKTPERSNSHSREHSDTSSRGEHRPIARPSSRQQRNDEAHVRSIHHAHGHDDRHMR